MALRLTTNPIVPLSMRSLFDRWVLSRRVVIEAEDNTRVEFDSALESVQRELDIEIALSREFGRRASLGFIELCALRCRVAEQIEAEDTRAEFDAIVSQLAHPSQGGEK